MANNQFTQLLKEKSPYCSQDMMMVEMVVKITSNSTLNLILQMMILILRLLGFVCSLIITPIYEVT